MWNEETIRKKNEPHIAAMTDLELKVIGKMIREEQVRRIQEEIKKLP